ncbi:MAG: BMC domain-containing protein [Ardenticatenales bacterium]|nr:BMC domain-containing protein [Ardenticatenales bacterium]
MDFPALALLEFSSIAAGIAAGDAMVKHAPVAAIQTGTVQPGHYLVLVTGDVASVEEAVKAGQEMGRETLRDQVFLPNVHPDVVRALGGQRQVPAGDALGIVETVAVAAAIGAGDAGIKGAEVDLIQIRLADGLGGKGLVFFTGLVSDVEAAVEIAATAAQPHLLRQVVISQLHPDMRPNVHLGRFGGHFDWNQA